MKLNPRKHLSEGYLRAYQDQELDKAAMERIHTHLATCETCQLKAQGIKDRADFVVERFEMGSPSISSNADWPTMARLQAYQSSKEVQPMYKKIISRQPRLVIAAILLLAVLMSTLAFPQVRAIATNFLGLFRVEKVVVVPINPANIPADISNAGPRIEQLLADDLTIEKFGETYEVGRSSEASAAAGIAVRLPESLGDPSKVTVQPGGRITFNIDLPRLRAILDEMGKQDLDLPQLLDGQTVTADLPASVTAMYGDCQVDVETAQEAGYDPDDPNSGSSDCMILVQLASPTVSAPPGLDIDQIGTTFLEMTGMSPEEAERFSQTVDWATTLVVPVPNYSSSSEVLVDGVQGVWVHQANRGDRSRYMLAWVKNGVVYSLSGRGSLEEAVYIANSLN